MKYLLALLLLAPAFAADDEFEVIVYAQEPIQTITMTRERVLANNFNVQVDPKWAIVNLEEFEAWKAAVLEEKEDEWRPQQWKGMPK